MSTLPIAQLICRFIRATTIGHERAIFQVMSKQSVPITTLQQPEIVGQLFVSATVQYFNSAYRSLILKNNAYIEGAFGAMHQFCGHSYICLLNIVFATCLSTHQSIDRSKLDVSSLENYQKSFELLLDPILADLQKNLAESLNHNCAGMDIDKCDPNKVMFSMQVSKKE